jgi:hypothetical protein
MRTGFSGHGFGIGPGAGRLIAGMVIGATPVVNPTPFRLSRFTDGSNPKPHVRNELRSKELPVGILVAAPTLADQRALQFQQLFVFFRAVSMQQTADKSSSRSY